MGFLMFPGAERKHLQRSIAAPSQLIVFQTVIFHGEPETHSRWTPGGRGIGITNSKEKLVSFLSELPVNMLRTS